MTPDERAATLTRTEAWFVRHGLPYFVDGERAKVREGLQRSRLVAVGAVAAVLGAGVGVLLGWLREDVSLGVSSALNVAGGVLAFYALTTLRVWAIARWAVARTFKSLGLLFPLVTRALPLLLLFVTFLFINAEVWQVASHLDGGVMWLAVMLFTAMAVGFLLVRLPEELDKVDDEVDPARLAASTRGTPLEEAARAFAESERPLRVEAAVTGFQKANLILVLLVAQIVQVVLLAVSVFVFFIVFGMVAMKEEVVVTWTQEDALSYPFGFTAVSGELVQVSVFLAAFSGLYFTVYAVTDELYRAQFFTTITRELERAVAARTIYQALKAPAAS